MVSVPVRNRVPAGIPPPTCRIGKNSPENTPLEAPDWKTGSIGLEGSLLIEWIDVFEVGKRGLWLVN